MAINWEEFDKDVDIENLEKDVEKASTGDFTGEDVPYGKYEVKITKLELTQSKKKDPMLSVWFQIINGQQKDRLIFMNQVVLQGFQIHTVNEFLKSLQTDENVEFKGYAKYNILILNIYEKIVNNEYELDYQENKKGYKTFKILQKFESSADNSNSSETEDLGWG
jgi:hypothetical protein|nr:MAG TPA: Protein of unknown function (DUF669) [Caudoviricetes sp.]